MVLPAAPVAAAVTAIVYAALLATTRIPCGADGTFCREGACERVRAHLAANLHGQDTAVNLLVDALCDHVASPRPNKPLVASLHGSPGIGKSYFHQLLAQALYNATGDGSHPAEDAFGNPIEPVASSDHPSGGGPWGGDSNGNSNGNSNGGNNVVDAMVDKGRVIKGYLPTFMGGDVAPRWNDANGVNARHRVECPGRDCPAYKVIFGTDYVTAEQEAQGRALRDAIVDHLAMFPESIIVIEEYDKMGCPARGMLKQLLDKGANGNATFHRSVFVLEANLGFVEINRRVRKGLGNSQNNVGDGSSGEGSSGGEELGLDELTATQRTLRDTVFKRWKDERCEEWSDTHKAVGSVDLFAPFLPLTRKSVGEVIEAHLRERTRVKRRARELARLTWARPDVVDFLVSQVEFEKEHAIEGGKEAGGVLSRWVTRALRRLAQAEDTARKKESQRRAVEEGRLWVDDRSGPPLRDRSVRLEVAKGGRELVASVVD